MDILFKNEYEQTEELFCESLTSRKTKRFVYSVVYISELAVLIAIIAINIINKSYDDIAITAILCILLIFVACIPLIVKSSSKKQFKSILLLSNGKRIITTEFKENEMVAAVQCFGTDVYKYSSVFELAESKNLYNFFLGSPKAPFVLSVAKSGFASAGECEEFEKFIVRKLYDKKIRLLKKK